MNRAFWHHSRIFLIAIYLIAAFWTSLAAILSSFPATTTVAVTTAKTTDSSAGEQHDKPIAIVQHTYSPVIIWGTSFGTPTPQKGPLLLALFAGAFGATLHAMQSLAAFVGNRRFVESWTLWYLFRVPIGAGLGLLLFAALRAGLVTGGAEPTSPYGVLTLGSLAGLFAKKALDKLREVFDTFFGTTELERDRLVETVLLAQIIAIEPEPIPALTDTPGDLNFSLTIKPDRPDITALRLDHIEIRLQRTVPGRFTGTLLEAQRRELAGRQCDATALGTPERISLTKTRTLAVPPV